MIIYEAIEHVQFEIIENNIRAFTVPTPNCLVWNPVYCISCNRTNWTLKYINCKVWYISSYAKMWQLHTRHLVDAGRPPLVALQRFVRAYHTLRTQLPSNRPALPRGALPQWSPGNTVSPFHILSACLLCTVGQCGGQICEGSWVSLGPYIGNANVIRQIIY